MRMLLFGLSIIALVLIGFFAITVFSPRIPDEPLTTNIRTESSLETPGATTTRAQFRSVPRQNIPRQNIQRQPVPSGFHGPTGAPHIIGPTSPPPNY